MNNVHQLRPPDAFYPLQQAGQVPLDGSGGGPNDPGMEARVAKLESTVEFIRNDVAETKANVRTALDTLFEIDKKLALIQQDQKNFATKNWLLGSAIGVLATVMFSGWQLFAYVVEKFDLIEQLLSK